MKQLKYMCQSSLPLLESQIIWLDQTLKKQGGSITRIHLFLYEIHSGDKTFYLKVNLMDNELYLFYNEKDVKKCDNFHEMRKIVLF